MELFPKKYLWLINILFCGIVSCNINKYNHLERSGKKIVSEQQIRPVIEGNSIALKYKASIDVLKYHFSGIVVVKQTDSITKHIVFVTELGMRIFDFEMKDTIFNTIFVFDPINKPQLVSALKTNFKNIFLLDVYNKPACIGHNKQKKLFYKLSTQKEKRFFVVTDTNKLAVQETFHKRKRSSTIHYNYSNTTHSYTEIFCKQYGIIKFYFTLNQL